MLKPRHCRPQGYPAGAFSFVQIGSVRWNASGVSAIIPGSCRRELQCADNGRQVENEKTLIAVT